MLPEAIVDVVGQVPHKRAFTHPLATQILQPSVPTKQADGWLEKQKQSKAKDGMIGERWTLVKKMIWKLTSHTQQCK